jgi:type IV pilus assembly protein PilE
MVAHRRGDDMKTSKGFSLLELMIVVLVIAVLAGIALSSYQNQVRKSRRAEAKQMLSDVSMKQEKYRSNNATFGTCDQVMSPSTCASFNLAGAFYSVAVTFPGAGTCPSGAAKGNANSYIITATPKVGTDQVKDASCTTLVLTSSCGTISKTATGSDSSNCW